ncbi:MAG: methylated-DNA--[protein]-cysteine S-methyltransferase [Alphaproteobacteria bacterium]|nr:methylated-DNA--[protein]-cysteine S-methyltransferase [Alphaproteobacteria bacterium]
MRLMIDRLPSPIGLNFIIWDEQERVRALDFEEYEHRIHSLLQKQYREFNLTEAQAPRALADRLDAYFSGVLQAIDTIHVKTAGTAFQQDAWSALRRIPPGKTASYGEQATRIGRPKAVRAVGAANGSNPVPVIIPCHRVIGSTGKLTGYGGGLARKQWLIAHEKRFSG